MARSLDKWRLVENVVIDKNLVTTCGKSSRRTNGKQMKGIAYQKTMHTEVTIAKRFSNLRKEPKKESTPCGSDGKRKEINFKFIYIRMLFCHTVFCDS